MAELTEGMVQNDKDGTIYRFFYDTVQNERASNESNRPIFDEVLMVEIITPGQRNSTPKYELKRTWAAESVKALNLPDPIRYSSKYNELRDWVSKYEASEGGRGMAGTPLKEWSRISRSLAATLSASNVFTVEQVANVPDSAIDVLGMGGRELRAQAQEFLGTSSDGALGSTLASRNAELERENQRLQAELAQANELLRQYANSAATAQPSPAFDPLAAAPQPVAPEPIVTPPAPVDNGGGLGSLV